MNFIVIALVSLVSGLTFAGGQSGGGGNGCWTKSARNWVTLEEVLYEDSFEKIEIASWKQNAYLRKGRYFLKSVNYIYEEDLTSNSFFRNGITRIQKLQSSYPETHKVIRELYDLMKHVQVAPVIPTGIFNGSVTEEEVPSCSEFSPGILTFDDGTVVMFKPVVASLGHTTTNVLFVHEAIRFAQMFHPAFANLSDKELELLTTVLFDWGRHEEVRSLLTSIEDKLTNRNFGLHEIKSQDSLSKKLFFTEINNALRNRRPLGTALNTFKNESANYDRAAKKALSEFFVR